MRVSRVYCNDNTIFRPIEFNEGLNVIYAKVTRPKDTSIDSHNLGKTLLIYLIDFLLLKSLEKGHFLYDNKVIFAGKVFFLELYTNQNIYVTIRRGVEKNTKICIQTHTEGSRNCSEITPENWKYSNLPLQKARTKLNELLCLSDIYPWDFRKGCGYFLRTQNDYRDVFQLARFAVGKHRDWKPFMAKLLGFNHEPLEKKYQVEEDIKEQQKLRESAKDITTIDTEEYDRIKGTLEIKRGELIHARQEIDRFNFYQEDMKYNTELVENLEEKISELNERIYTIDYELAKIKDALTTNISFNLHRVENIFKEAQIILPDSIVKSYEELIDFNNRLSIDRGKRLKEQNKQLSEDRSNIVKKLKELNERRSELLSVLQDTNSLRKFRTLQKTLVSMETDIARLEAQLEQLDKVAQIDKNIRKLLIERGNYIEEIQTMVNMGNPLYRNVRHQFHTIVKTILNLPGVISISVNREGNIEFEANLLKNETSQVITSEDKGTSYRRLLCCAFDMALLHAHRKGSFYRFVYHDGVFEGLDNRKKRQLLEVIKGICEKDRIQYILTVIEADIPRDENDKPILFGKDEVILKLFEGANEGRLFKISKF